MGIWLYGLSPTLAASLVICCSIISQIQTLPILVKAISFKRVLPFLIPGIIAVPMGTHLLYDIDADSFKYGIGSFLLIYSTLSLMVLNRPTIIINSRIADSIVGFGGGLLGGVAGLSGPIPVMWSKFRGWSKDQRRSTFQLYNLCILCIALIAHGQSGLLNRELGTAVLIALPGTLFGAWVGSMIYKSTDDYRFDIYVLLVLLAAGASLIVTTA